ncbi:hypothetical protein [Phytoactinopolyspora halotolerans]|uniref:Uncharacterized protein n=1 Tax=Phytoactinopolyspora halotolerans TaxID=1981512 RepID=A0A6L9S8J5_9ACTN|nr:hypothetical protein [Phytoactinopolyspora halotolerans]NEE00912.1 hypothetical protein [Phytoactinopolyspora halotolerans]
MADLPAALFQRWAHVDEEDTPGVRVYRPADRPLPPARGRDGIEFRTDGTYIAWEPGAADAPYPSEPRQWSLAGPDRLRLHGQDGPIIEVVVAVSDEVLLLREASDG